MCDVKHRLHFKRNHRIWHLNRSHLNKTRMLSSYGWWANALWFNVFRFDIFVFRHFQWTPPLNISSEVHIFHCHIFTVSRKLTCKYFFFSRNLCNFNHSNLLIFIIFSTFLFWFSKYWFQLKTVLKDKEGERERDELLWFTVQSFC